MRVNQVLGLPDLAVQNLRKIVKFHDERGGEARLVVSDAHHTLEASIGAAGKLSDFHLTGVTTLYGTVIRVGGVDPRVEFQPVKGKTLFCPAERSIVLQLRDYLYQTVALEGQATWDAATLEVVHFTIRNWYPYVPTSPVAAFAELRERYGRYFDTIDDVDAWVAAVRRGDV